jgi:hypothetical protein
MNELPVGKDRECRRAGTEINAGDAELGLVRRDHRKRARIGRRDEAGNAEMAALDAQHHVAHRHFVGGDGMEIDGKAFAAHALRFADAGIVVEPVA